MPKEQHFLEESLQPLPLKYCSISFHLSCRARLRIGTLAPAFLMTVVQGYIKYKITSQGNLPSEFNHFKRDKEIIINSITLLLNYVY